jgi:predicted nuclease with TOPRIM domain
MEDHESLLDVREDLADKMEDIKSLREDLAETEELHTARVDEAARLKCQLNEERKREEEMSARIADIESSLFEIAEALGCADKIVYTNAEPMIQVINKHLNEVSAHNADESIHTEVLKKHLMK